MFVEGIFFQMIIVLVIIIMTILYISNLKKGKKVSLRPLPSLEALEEAIGRAVEMGRPVHFSPGFAEGGMYNPQMGPAIMAGITIFKRVVELTAKKGGKIIVSLSSPEVIPIIEDIVKTGYTIENMEPPTDVIRFHGQTQYVFTAGILNVYQEDFPGANILVGFFYGTTIILLEAGITIGAMQIAGSSEVGQLPFMLATADYTILPEELFAAASYIDKDAPHLGSLMAQDFIRMFILALILLSVLARNINIQWLFNILKM